MSILTEDKSLRFGYTTGACAAAGVRACLLYLAGEPWERADFSALDGTALSIPVKAVRRLGAGAEAEVVKFSGDDPDITNGISIFTRLEPAAGEEILFVGGEGVGRVTKAGLSLPVGESAINPGPRELIRRAIRELAGKEGGYRVTISIPAGTELAKRTLNPVLGIEGGISVIGTTGVLRPMSEEAFKDSLVPQIDVALAARVSPLVLVPGKIGERAALRLGIPKAAIIETSNFIGFMLEKAAEREAKEILLLGHLGKIAKVAAGVFYTHNRIGDARLETLAAYAAAEGLGKEQVRRLLAANTTDDALSILDEAGDGLKMRVLTVIAARASLRAERYLFGRSHVGTALVTMAGDLLALDEAAKKMGEAAGWQMNIKS